MTERDAFGNPIDPARGTSGGLSVGDPLRPAPAAAAPAPTPAPAADAAALTAATSAAFGEAPSSSPPPPPPPATVVGGSVNPALFAPTERVRGRFDWTDKLVALFFVAVFVVPFAIGGWAAWSAWHDTAKPAISAIKDVQRTITPATPGSDDAGTPAAPKPPAGLSARSLLRPAAVGRVLAAARREPGGGLHLLRLAPERADLQMARKAGGLDLLQLRWDGGRTLVHTPGTGPSKAITFSSIDPGAPLRLVRSAARRLHKPASAIDYVVLINILGGPKWSAYFTGGAAFQGDAHGHITRRIQ